MKDFKLILGMDWLSQYWVVHCFEKTITLRIPSIPEFTWKNQLETTTQMMALENISDIDLVKEFLDIFPKYLPSLPPKQEI